MVSPDGQRFLMNTVTGEESVPRLGIIGLEITASPPLCSCTTQERGGALNRQERKPPSRTLAARRFLRNGFVLDTQVVTGLSYKEATWTFFPAMY